jgi:hypothetical protein
VISGCLLSATNFEDTSERSNWYAVRNTGGRRDDSLGSTCCLLSGGGLEQCGGGLSSTYLVI